MLLVALGAGCYSRASLQTAEVMRPGERDFMIGAVSLVLPIIDANLGVARGLQVGARFEGLSLTLDGRAQVVGVRGEGVDVCLEGGWGFSLIGQLPLSGEPHHTVSCYADAGACVSRTFERMTPYLNVRYLWKRDATGEDEVLEVFLGAETSRRKEWQLVFELLFYLKGVGSDPESSVGFNVGLRIRPGSGE